MIPHLGSFADDWRAQRVMIDVLARHPNVYTDTSGVRRFHLLVEAVQRAGPKGAVRHRWPVASSRGRAVEVLALRLLAHQRHLVLAGNWLRLTAAARTRARSRLRPAGPAPARATSGRAAPIVWGSSRTRYGTRSGRPVDRRSGSPQPSARSRGVRHDR